MVEPLAARDEPRVGHGVGGTGEEIGETDGLAHASGKDRQRKIEAPTDLPQEGTEQVVGHATRSRRASAGDRACPSPSSGLAGISDRAPCPSGTPPPSADESGPRARRPSCPA